MDPDIEDSCEEECAIPNVKKQLLISPQFEKLKKIKYNFLFQHLKGQSKLNATSWDQVTYGAQLINLKLSFSWPENNAFIDHGKISAPGLCQEFLKQVSSSKAAKGMEMRLKEIRFSIFF